MRSPGISAIALLAGITASTPALAHYLNAKWCASQGLPWINDAVGCKPSGDGSGGGASQGGQGLTTPRPSQGDAATLPLCFWIKPKYLEQAQSSDLCVEDSSGHVVVAPGEPSPPPGQPMPMPRANTPPTAATPTPPAPNAPVQPIGPTPLPPGQCAASATPQEMRSFCTQAFAQGHLDPLNAGDCAGWFSVFTTGVLPSSAGDCPQPSGACRQVYDWPCSSDSPWNTPIGTGARFGGSGDARVVSLRKHGRASFNTTSWSVAIGKPGQNVSVPGGTDAETATIAANGVATDTYHAGSGSPYVKTYDAKGSCIASGAGQLGIRAGGPAAIAGLVRNWEVQPGAKIQHALAFSVCTDQMKQGPVWPATSQDNFASQYSGSIPMGTLFAIPSTVNIASLGLSAAGQKVAEAAQKYGAYVVDQGCGPAFMGEPSMDRSAAGQIAGDISKIAMSMDVVTNNTTATPGGGGTPLAPSAPEFCQ